MKRVLAIIVATLVVLSFSGIAYAVDPVPAPLTPSTSSVKKDVAKPDKKDKKDMKPVKKDTAPAEMPTIGY